jgi:hypothetical protein
MLTCAMPRTSFSQEVSSVIQVQDASAAAAPTPTPAPAPAAPPAASPPSTSSTVESKVTAESAPVPAAPAAVAPAAAPAPAAEKLLPAAPASDESPWRRETEGLRTRGERQRLAGILLLLAGVGLGAGGGVIISRCCTMPATTNFTNPSQVQPLVDDARNQVIAGGVMAGLGVGAFVTGLSLWGVGQSNINAARRLGQSLALTPAPAGSMGAGLRLGF